MPWAIPAAKRVFLHIPKTGGNWIITAIRKLGLELIEFDGSETYADAAHVYPEFERFTVIRNPLTWYPSYWTNCQIFGCGGLACLAISKDCEQNLDSFPNFMESVLRNHPAYLVGLYAQYAVPGVEVLFTETIASGLSSVLNESEITYDPHILETLAPENRCASRPEYQGKTDYPSGMVQRVVKSERALFDRYHNFDQGVV